ncbi:hypothetical protein GRI36_12035 [Altererythrobacter gangjinensis]|uniref:Glycosyl transferase family 8 n=1 Tax=Pontixanthobacter gangjinensis TaxID=1028742 RepID=A0A6I4SQG2_9SPHN|nr:hypothetical protein [Pontixanthobacter gangjinensis]
MAKPAPAKIDTLVTVTSRDYLPGTWVMLHSFLQAHPDFDGDIAVLADDLADKDKYQLSVSFERIGFSEPSEKLARSIADLTRSVPKLQGRARRFFSLEAFNPARAGNVLFCDSDLLFRSGIDAMLAMDGAIIACGDRAQLIGSGRDQSSLAELDGSETRTPVRDGFATFNAGLMLIRPELRTPENWAALLGHLDHKVWGEIATQHTDQAVYNKMFGRQVTLAGASHNYLVGHGSALRNAAIAPMSEAKVLHFNGPAKPWHFGRHLDAATADASYVRAFQDWYSAYTRFLTSHHFVANTGSDIS